MLSQIVAIAKNNAIGCHNKLLWHLPEDLQYFKTTTSGKTIIMGRRTFESLPFVLPNRKHIILTKDPHYSVDHPMVTTVLDPFPIYKHYKDTPEEAFIIGGGMIYHSSLPYVTKLYVTQVDENFDGDTFYPPISEKEFLLTYRSDKKVDESSHLSYEFLQYCRI